MVVPSQGRDFVLGELHGGHPGVSRMKALARGLVWWPGLDGGGGKELCGVQCA